MSFRFASGWRALALATLFICGRAGAVDVAACEACHGKDGNSQTPGTPSIAGQPATFLVNQLIYFREELRASPIMQPLTKGMKDTEATAFAKHFASRPVSIVSTEPVDAVRQKRGRELAGKLFCGQCHLPSYRGRDQMPRLAGQREDYLVSSMKAYRDNTRTGADTTMAGVLNGVSDADILALAHFLSRLK